MDLLAPIVAKMASWWTQTPVSEKMWLCVGIVGQLMFSMRWVLQWLASERARTSVVPANFWYYSLVGGLMVLSYGLYKGDPVIILGQIGVLVYARNVYFLLAGDGTMTPTELEPAAEAARLRQKKP